MTYGDIKIKIKKNLLGGPITLRPFGHIGLLSYNGNINELNEPYKNCKIKPGFKTDHSLISLKLNVSKLERENEYFKVNNSMLLEDKFRTIIKQSLKEATGYNTEVNPTLCGN